jgi:hypothetical protein
MSAMLIHRKISYVPSSKLCTDRREAQSRETDQQSKNSPCISQFIIRADKQGYLSKRIMIPSNSSIYFSQRSFSIRVYALYVNYLLHVSAFRPSSGMRTHCCGSAAHTSHYWKFILDIFYVVYQHKGWAVQPVVNVHTWWWLKGWDRSRLLRYSVSDRSCAGGNKCNWKYNTTLRYDTIFIISSESV